MRKMTKYREKQRKTEEMISFREKEKNESQRRSNFLIAYTAEGQYNTIKVKDSQSQTMLRERNDESGGRD